jgi:hypothetical protein
MAVAGCTPATTTTPGACETVTVTAGQASTAAPAPAGVYSGNGVWSVGDQPSGGAQRSIPPGRYTFTTAPGQQLGTVIRCSAVVGCTLAGAAQLSIENANGADYSSVMEILPSDGAVWMQYAVLTRVP